MFFFYWRGKLTIHGNWNAIFKNTATIVTHLSVVVTKGNTHLGNVVAVLINGVLIRSAYLSASQPVDIDLVEVWQLIERHQEVIVTGIFNCHFRTFIDRELRARDLEFQDFLDVLSLEIANDDSPTLIWSTFQSINDYTLHKNVDMESWLVLSHT